MQAEGREPATPERPAITSEALLQTLLAGLRTYEVPCRSPDPSLGGHVGHMLPRLTVTQRQGELTVVVGYVCAYCGQERP